MNERLHYSHTNSFVEYFNYIHAFLFLLHLLVQIHIYSFFNCGGGGWLIRIYWLNSYLCVSISFKNQCSYLMHSVFYLNTFLFINYKMFKVTHLNNAKYIPFLKIKTNFHCLNYNSIQKSKINKEEKTSTFPMYSQILSIKIVITK